MIIMHNNIDYTWLSKVENELRSSIYQMEEIKYIDIDIDTVQIESYVEESQTKRFIEWMTEFTNGQTEISVAVVEYLEEEK